METENGYVVLKIPTEPSTEGKAKKEETRVCEVCGHPNDKQALMCKMCSNYLTKGER